MHKAQCTGMERLSRTHGKAISHKLLVLPSGSASKYLVAAVTRVIEKGMSDVLHVNPYLMGAARFEHTLNHA